MSFGFGFGMAKAAAFLSGPVPSLNLQFAGATTLDPRITFTRASSATYFDSTGVLQRATYNLLTYSAQFDNAAWSAGGLTVGANVTASPDGAVTADKISEDATTGGHLIVQTTSSLTTATTYTFSVFLKAAERTFAFVGFNTGSMPTVFVSVNLTNGTVATATGSPVASAIQAVGNGWYRVSISATTTGSGVTTADVRTSTDGVWANRSYTGTTGSGIFIWGAQLEQASTAGPYYATTTAANGAPRFDYNPTTLAPRGLLIEEQRTNLLLNSENASAWTATGLNITANTVVAPDGALTADKIAADTSNVGHVVELSTTVVASTAYTFSIYLKAAEETVAVLWNNVGGSIATFDLVAGTVTSGTGTISSVGNGWYRCSIAYTPGGTFGQVRVYIRQSTSWIGNGSGGFFIWGAQLEAGSFATSYIPTVAAQVTRSADSASMTGSNFSSWYNATEGTLFSEGGFASAPLAGGNRFAGVATINDGTTNNYIGATYGVVPGASLRYIGAAVVTGGVDQTAFASTNINENQAYKVALAFKANDTNSAISGVATTTDTSVTLPVVNQLLMGVGRGGNSLNGHIRRIAFYPTRLANATLQALTT